MFLVRPRQGIAERYHREVPTGTDETPPSDTSGSPGDTSPEAPTGTVKRSVGVIMIQGLNSLTTVIQMALFAIVLPRSDFDEYAVWVTSGMFLVGLAQAVGTDRVLIGNRTFSDGASSGRVLALAVTLGQLGVAAGLGNVDLLLCSLAMFAYVTYDFQRYVRCFTEAKHFLRRDLVVVGSQVLLTTVAWAVWGDNGWLVLTWWLVALPFWWAFGGPDRGRLREGVTVLRLDVRECLPLLADAVLAGVPLVVALALVQAQGAEGEASAARMAFTILGPITVLGVSARRLVYHQVAQGPLSRAFAVRWVGVVALTFALCAGLLALTRTQLYPWAFPGFVGLTWLAILGFATNHSAMLATFLPAASLRAERRSSAVGLSRVVASIASAGAGVLLFPFTSPADVAWCVAAGSIAYAASLFVARAVIRTEEPAPVES